MTHVNAGIARSPWKTRLSIGRNHDDLTHRNADYEWAIKKLKEYKFLDGYITEGEITEKLRKYEKKGEKVCKWPMLVIDEVYSKIKVEDK